MKYSVTVQTRINDWKIIKEYEDLGYDAAWVPDTQMMWSDCYATLALAAANTSKIRLGTGVAIPGTRIAPTTAAAISSINAIAPGRVFLGIGTGHTAMRVMGHNPMPVKEFREYLRVVRTMLAGDPVDYTYRGKTTEIVWQDHGEGFRNTTDPIPIYVAANGPLALKAAGAYGDGLVSLFNEQPDTIAHHLAQVKEGAEEVDRALADDFYTTALSNAVVLQPGEKLTDDRVIEMSGSFAVCAIHFVYEIWQYVKNDEVVPSYLHGIWEDYCHHVEQFQVPVEDRHQVLHEGHCSYYPAGERRFLTPEVIEGTTIIGSPKEIADQLKAAEDNGLSEVSLLPPLAHAREAARDFAEQVIPLM